MHLWCGCLPTPESVTHDGMYVQPASSSSFPYTVVPACCEEGECGRHMLRVMLDARLECEWKLSFKNAIGSCLCFTQNSRRVCRCRSFQFNSQETLRRTARIEAKPFLSTGVTNSAMVASCRRPLAVWPTVPSTSVCRLLVSTRRVSFQCISVVARQCHAILLLLLVLTPFLASASTEDGRSGKLNPFVRTVLSTTSCTENNAEDIREDGVELIGRSRSQRPLFVNDADACHAACEEQTGQNTRQDDAPMPRTVCLVRLPGVDVSRCLSSLPPLQQKPYLPRMPFVRLQDRHRRAPPLRCAPYER